MRGFIPQKQLFGVAAAGLSYNTVSGVMATTAVRWLKLACMSYFDDFGVISKGSCVQMALKAFTELNAARGFDLEGDASEYGFGIEFLGVTVRLSYTEGFPCAQLFLDCKRVGTLSKRQ